MSARSSWRTRVLQGAIVLTPLAYGTVHALPVLLFQVSGFLLFAAWAYEEARQAGHWRHLRDPLLLVGYAGIGLGCLQLIPLPPALLAIVSPGTFRWAQAGLTDVGLEPAAFSAIAVVPHAAESGMLWFAALVAWFAVVQHECRSRERARSLVLTIAATSAGLALLGLGQSLSGAESIYWVGLTRPEFFATFVNPNNAAGLLTLGAMACLGIAFTSPSDQKGLWYAAAVLSGAAACMTLSRGGIGVLVLAFLLLAWLRGIYQPPDTRGVRAWRLWALRFGPLGFLVTIALFVLWVGQSDVLGEMRTVADDGDLNGRIPIWRDSLAGMWPAFPFFGIGYGNFEHVFPAYHTQASRVTYTAVENEYLHVLLEGGLAGAALLGIALTIGWRRVRSAAKSARPEGMTLPLVAGLAGFMVHLLIDFPLHLGAPALWFMTTAAAIMNRPAVAGERGATLTAHHQRRSGKDKGPGDPDIEQAGIAP